MCPSFENDSVERAEMRNAPENLLLISTGGVFPHAFISPPRNIGT